MTDPTQKILEAFEEKPIQYINTVVLAPKTVLSEFLLPPSYNGDTAPGLPDHFAMTFADNNLPTKMKGKVHDCYLNEYILSKQMVTFVPPYADQSWQWESDVKCLNIKRNALFIPKHLVFQSIIERYDQDPRDINISHHFFFNPLISELCREILKSYHNGIDQIHVDILIQALISCFHEYFILNKKEHLRSKGLSPKRLTLVLDYMNSHFATATLDDMSEVVSLSKFYFLRAFKKSMGVTPAQHLSQIKLKEAKRRLKSTQEPLECIATAIGYQDVRALNHFFKKETGVTPYQYRKSKL